jgi:hypothetical protein
MRYGFFDALCIRPAAKCMYDVIFCICIVLLMHWAPAGAGDTPGMEMLVNGSFEDWEEGRPVGWDVSIGASEDEGAESMLQPGEDAGTGQHSLLLSGDDGTKVWYAASQEIKAEAGEVFHISGRLRTENVAPDGHRYHNCQITVIAKTAGGQRVNLWILGSATGTTEWNRHDRYFQTPQGAAILEVSVFLSMSGSAYFDDISLMRLPAPATDAEAPRDERWRADLAYLADFLPKLHVKPFTITSEEDFRARVAELDEAISELSDLQINLRLMALVASLGDAHSSIGFAEQPRALPVQFEFFGDEMRVIAVDRNCADVAGGKVTHIGGVELKDVLASVRPLIACETECWFRCQAPSMLRLTDVIYGLGLSESEGEVKVEVITESGEEKTCTIELPPPGRQVEYEVREAPVENRPLYLSERAYYWYRYLDDSRTFYVQYNACHESPQRPMSKFTMEVENALDVQAIDRFVLDLRRNMGGSSTLLNGLIRAVAERKSSGHIKRCYVITGCETFSAAALNALDFRQATGALVAGEPMGNKPNRFGQLNVFTLPNSGLHVQYATKHFVRLPGDPPILAPDIPVEITWDDYLEGRDPVMERILADE